MVFLEDEWGDFLRSSRDEEPREKAQSVLLVGRCVDNNEQLRSTPLSVDLKPESCRFGGPIHRWVSSPTVSYLHIYISDRCK